ncbi:MAG: M23 family metallopeptidase [archaeon]
MSGKKLLSRIALFLILAAVLAAIVWHNISPETGPEPFGEILPYNGKVVKPVAGYSVCSNYGLRLDPFTGKLDFHNAIDLCAPEGRLVRAAKDGNVVAIGNDLVAGNFVRMQHPDGTYTSYFHLLSVSDRVSVGSNIGAGTGIGLVGSTGRSTGPHLHFSLQDGNETFIDPSGLLGIRNDGNGIGEDGTVSLLTRITSFFTPSTWANWLNPK